jgi:hypothetical protein
VTKECTTVYITGNGAGDGDGEEYNGNNEDEGQTVIFISDDGSEGDTVVWIFDKQGIEDNEQDEEEEIQTFVFLRPIILDIHAHEGVNWGKRYKINLAAGHYRLIPTGGAVNDEITAGTKNYWAWNVSTSAGEICGGFSMMYTAQTDPFAATAAEAFASVAGISLDFNWPGGAFELWIPSNDTGGDNNDGKLNLLLISSFMFGSFVV